MISWMWYFIALVNAVSLVESAINGTPTFEHEALMMLAIVLGNVCELKNRESHG